jgi:uncharacterized protein (TIGR03437 family)
MPSTPLSPASRRRIEVRLLPVLVLAVAAQVAPAASPDRIARPVDARELRVVADSVHHLALAKFDQGPVDDGMPMKFLVLMFKLSAAQQAGMDSLLADQQNPASPLFHKWITPEEYADRFGLSPSDQSKVAAWLHSEGFSVKQLARGRNWIAFDGTAGQVSRALHTGIHRFHVTGENHYANTGEISVPAALEDVVGGVVGLNDFRLKSNAMLVPPDYNAGSSHYLAPADIATIYDLTPLYQAGIDGTGQSIAVVGESDVLPSDLRTFRTRNSLPANDPKLILYDGVDPGFNSTEAEGVLDLEWAGAIAPKATIYYVYGASAIAAMVSAVNAAIAPVVSVSYGGCEVGWRQAYWRAVMQQANVQGITVVNSSGDSGASGCDAQGEFPFATLGRIVDFPAVLPEVTGVGGTQFVEGTGSYWASANSTNLGSALSYIPEAAWNESGPIGLASTGGGASSFYSKPAWQTGPGVPNDSARDVPDISLSAAIHDSYLITYLGATAAIAGTSCSAPAFAGMLALLNQYQVAKGFQKQPGLGNINPQLYRLAQSAPSAFHDIISGDNAVSCAQGSPDCLTGSYGYPAGVGYDLATGLGTIDANNLVTQWNTQTDGVVVTFTASPTKATLNDTIQLTATVAAASGTAVPTGSVAFSSGGVALGSAALASSGGRQTGSVTFPLYLLGYTGTWTVVATYSGDAAFSSGGATTHVQVSLPATGAAIIPTWPDTVWPSLPPDAQGLTWQTQLGLSEVAGVAASIASFTIDGQPQPLSQYFPAGGILPGGAVTTSVIFRNLAAPVTRTFGFAGTDITGRNWSRQVSVNYLPLPPYVNFNVSATPLTVVQNAAADPSCQWPIQLTVDDLGGSFNVLTGLLAGSADLSAQIPAIFGTPRLAAWGSLQGQLCLNGITPPATDFIQVVINGSLGQEVLVSFAPAPPNPAALSVSPAAVNLITTSAAQPVQSSLSVGISDKTQSWTATILPTNRTGAWLSASQLSGTGPAQIVLKADGAGFEPGVYRATIVIQSPGATPQFVSVPVMFVSGASYSGTAIAGVANAASTGTAGSPGMLLSVYGTKLANSTQAADGSPLPFSLAGVSATVNGLAAPLTYVSPGQINLQIPYEAGAGPAVLGIDNNGQIAGFAFQIAPAAPGILADSAGNLLPSATVQQGGTTTLYLTGAGDVSPSIFSGQAPASGTAAADLPVPLLPLSVTVGGVPAFVQFAGIPAGLIGTVQVNFTVPASVPAGTQPVVATVGGKASPPVSLKIH